MTHPPPDPEGRRQQDGGSGLDPQWHEAARWAEREWAAGRLPGKRSLSEVVAWLLAQAHAKGLEEARADAAARLDAALAVKDAGEAVERAWALVRELRGEEA